MEKYKKLLLALVILLAGCTKNFLDINTDPNNPSKATLGLLLTHVEKSIADGLNVNFGLSNITSVYMMQTTTRENPDQYGITGGSAYTSAPWNFFYTGPLQDLELMISQASADGNVTYSGIAKILKAYTFSQMVDIWGDIPFSEANKLSSTANNAYPKWDKSSDIYTQIFALLDDGLADLTNTTAANKVTPSGEDIIYSGDKAKWIRAAKTIKLKLLNQVRKVQDVSTAVSALVTAGDLIKSGEDFEFQYGSKSSPDERNPGFLDYEAGQRSYYQSPWFYEILKGKNTTIFTGLVDPRIPFYFYNQLTTGQATREGNPTEYRDGGFVSIFFGSISKNRDHATDGSMTVFGVYPVGGRYDDGGHIKVTGPSGTGAAPYRFITYADRLYIQAELANAGLIPDVAPTYFQQAVEASFKQVDHVVSKVNPALASISQAAPPTMWVPSATAPVPPTPATTGWLVKAYMTNLLAQYAAATTTRKLELIMTEKWISQFGCNVDTWTDYRRTGYPIVFNPLNPVQAPGGQVLSPDGFVIPVTLTNPIPWTVDWPTSDLSINPNAPAQKDPSTFKVFYDVH
ncbi:MAG TPA: SusD/RagB family nutrient-binding outer membrane lipoprotein [Bacteroidales bacterium]